MSKLLFRNEAQPQHKHNEAGFEFVGQYHSFSGLVYDLYYNPQTEVVRSVCGPLTGNISEASMNITPEIASLQYAQIFAVAYKMGKN